MKINKKKLVQLTAEKLNYLGYKDLNDSLMGADCLFIKSVSNGYFLTLGLIISRFENYMFTASYYLSKSTRWSAVWGDIPSESYKRVGYFLSNEERAVLLDENQNKIGVIDAWWDGSNEQSIVKFSKAIQLTEKRFLNQPNLFEKIENSKEVKELFDNANLVNAKVSTNKFKTETHNYVPLNSIDDIPINWFKAAEEVIIEKGGILNSNTVKLLAADAWYKNITPVLLQLQQSKGEG